MAWIESHQQLERHPKVTRLMGDMGWSLDETLGKLHRFWWWCLEYAPTGDLRRYNDSVLAGSVGLSADSSEKFVKAMVAACWLDRGDDVFRVHDWPHYAARYLKDSKFKRHPDKWLEVVNLYKIDCPQTVLEQSVVPTNQPTIPNQPTKPPLPAGWAEEFAAFWAAYPKKVGRAACEAKWKKLKPDLQKCLATIETLKGSVQWKKENGQFIPNPETWLNQGRWDDELPAIASASPAAGRKEERSKGEYRLTKSEQPKSWNPLTQ